MKLNYMLLSVFLCFSYISNTCFAADATSFNIPTHPANMKLCCNAKLINSESHHAFWHGFGSNGNGYFSCPANEVMVQTEYNDQKHRVGFGSRHFYDPIRATCVPIQDQCAWVPANENCVTGRPYVYHLTIFRQSGRAIGSFTVAKIGFTSDNLSNNSGIFSHQFLTKTTGNHGLSYAALSGSFALANLYAGTQELAGYFLVTGSNAHYCRIHIFMNAQAHTLFAKIFNFRRDNAGIKCVAVNNNHASVRIHFAMRM